MTTQADNKTAWPTRDILWLGYFGSGTPAGARYRNRSLTALGLLFIVGAVLLSVDQTTAVRLAMSTVPGIAFGFIALEWWRYISSLDELARRIQVEAMAWTYVVGAFVAMALAGAGIGGRFNVNPAWFIILLEPLRAYRLWSLSRRY